MTKQQIVLDFQVKFNCKPLISAINRTVAAQKGQLSSRSTHSKPVMASIFVFFFFGFMVEDDDIVVGGDDEPWFPSIVVLVPFSTVSTSPVLDILAVAVVVVDGFSNLFLFSSLFFLYSWCLSANSFFRWAIILLISSRSLTRVMLLQDNYSYPMVVSTRYYNEKYDAIETIASKHESSFNVYYSLASIAGFFAMDVHIPRVGLAFSNLRPIRTVCGIRIDTLLPSFGI